MWPVQRLYMVRKWNNWVLLAWLLTFRVMSAPLWKKFPTLDSILAAGLITRSEFNLLKAKIATKKLKNNEYALVVIEWLVNLNAESFSDYPFPIYHKNIFNAIQLLKKSASNLIRLNEIILELLVDLATLFFFVYGMKSWILGHVVEYSKDQISCIPTCAVLYPIFFAIALMLFEELCLRYLRPTFRLFGRDDKYIMKRF
jgi:hypothetical protein